MKKKLKEIDVESILEENKKLKEENKRLHQIFDYMKKNILAFEDELSQYKDAARAKKHNEMRQVFLDVGESLEAKLKIKIEDLPIQIRTMNVLKARYCDTLGDIVAKDKAFFKQGRYMGSKGFDEIMEVLEFYGLDFGMNVETERAEKP